MTEYANMFYLDPSILGGDELTPEELEEIGKCKYEIIKAAQMHWRDYKRAGDDNMGMLGCQLELMSPDFVHALAKAVKARCGDCDEEISED